MADKTGQDRRSRLARRLRESSLPGTTVILALGLAGFFLLPDNLALLTRIIAIALLVLSLDLVTGYCGVATLGHAALFGAGAYGAGIAAVHFGINDPVAMTLAGAASGAVAGLVSGAVIARAHGLAQLVLSIAVVHLFHEAANKASAWTGGSDGLSGIMPLPLLGLYEFDLWGKTAYLYGIGLFALVFALARMITRSPFGLLARGVREDPVRVAAMGVSVRSVLIRMYVISGAVAGTGGALAALSTQVVGLDSLSFTLSAQALVILVVGGAGSLYGAPIGAVLFLFFEDVVSAANPFHWLAIVGALLIVTVLVAPRGLYGTALTLVRGRKGKAAE